MNEVIQCMHFSYNSLKRLQFFSSFNAKLIVVQSRLLPLRDYTHVCYLDITETLLYKLAIRSIFILRKYDCISELRSTLKWLSIALWSNMHIPCLLYKLLDYTYLSHYLRSSFTHFSPASCPKRTFDTRTYLYPRSISKFFHDSFTAHAARMWNKMPVSIRDSTSF